MPFQWSCSHHPPERSAKVAAIISASLATLYGLNAVRLKWMRTKKTAQKRAECSEAKSKLQKHLDDTRSGESLTEQITSLSFEDLRAGLRSGDLDPVTVLRAYQRKALEVDRRLNCLVEPINAAEEWASDCSRGALYGVPVSLKDILPIKGCGVTFGGCINAVGMMHMADAAIVTVLKNQGAIPFVITNAPQMLMSFACTNPIFGFTGNPRNPERTPGGSSGGEGALIGGGGSILGIGTDLGGSVRVPAAFCGICSLKPTLERNSNLGFFPFQQNLVQPCNGPMARDVDTLVEYMRIMDTSELFELDPCTTPIPFREELYSSKKPLRIGYYCDDGFYPAIPAYHRAIREAKAILEKQGHTLVPFQIPDVGSAMEIGLGALFGDGGAMFKMFLWGDEAIPDLVFPFWVFRLPPLARRVLAWLWGLCDRTQAVVIRSMIGVRSVPEWWQLTGALETYRRRVIAEWQGAKLDCVLCPPSASVALPDGVTGKLGIFYSYTFLYNVLNFPAGVVPLTRVNSDDVKRLSEYIPQTHGQKILKKAMSGSDGLPVGVQCVALPFREELVLRLMKAVETGVRQAGGPGR